jgi:DNA-directed RNA polymerase subunit H (RpoH/RPB5)
VDDIADAILQFIPVIKGEKNDRKAIDVYISDDDKVGVKFARHVLDKSQNSDIIVISLEGPTPFTRKECDGHKIQFMFAKDLCFNVTKHSLVPKHEVVKAPPGNLNKDQLPHILDTDPIVQYYNWPIGTIVRVWRCYAGHEPIPYYRCVSFFSN